MPIRSSGYFNDPALAQGFANLQALFQPPSGSDLAGYATANATRQKAAQLAQLFDYSQQQDGFDQAQFDRMGQATGQWTPSSGYYGVNTTASTTRRGQDITAQTALATNAADNARALEERRMQEAAALERLGITDATSRANNTADNDRAMREAILRQATDPVAQGAIRPGFNPSDYGVSVPQVPEFAGREAPLNEGQWQAAQNQRLLESGQLTDDMLIDGIMGERAPVQAVGPEGAPVFMSPGAAVRQGAAPYEKPSAERVDNYLAIGPNNEEKRFVGYIGPDGSIHDVATRQPVPNVIRKESTGGGMSFETDGQGGIRLSTGNAAGNTTARTTDLQRQEAEAGRAVNELTALFDTLRPDDLGAAGNINELLTNYGAQMFPTLARPDVAATRAQLKATTLGLARSLVQDERLSDADRRAANEVMVGGGLGESLPGAQAKLASLVALSAYRQKYANSVRMGGDRLPALDGAMLGRLVDEGAISPRVAQVYAATVLNRGAQAPGGPIPGVNLPEPGASPPAATGAPQPGTIEDGFRFKGGNPADPANWERAN